MHSVEQLAIQTYQRNMEYFKDKHSDLHAKLIALDTAISEGLYTEKYSLEYKDEGYFDVQEIESGEFLYGENSQTYTQKLLKTVDLRRTGAVFEGQQRFDIKEEELEEIGDFKNFHSSLWATAKIIHYNSEVAPKFSSRMEKLYKFIFLGSGLGLHIEKVVSSYGVQVAFIHEHNLEIFRLSLFVTNYVDILKNCVSYFSVMQNYSDMQQTFTSFLNEAFNHNLYIKFLPFAKEYTEDLQNLQSITLSQNHIMYPFQAYMARSFNAADKVTKGDCFLNINYTYSDTLFSHKPVLVLASGPSLQNNTEWIKKNQDNFLVIGVLSACAHLFYHDIRPDIVVHVDPQEHASLLIIKDMDMSKFDNSKIIFGSSVHNKVIEKFQRDDIVFIEEATTFKVNHGYFTLPSIGEYATMLPLILGAKEVFLIGLDLSLDPNTMKDHIDMHVVAQTLSHADNEESVEYQKSVCYVKGNFLETVPSKPNFRFSLTQFKNAAKMFKQPHQNIYNLSNGAYLEGTIPLHIENEQLNSFTKLDKKTIRQELELFLSTNSSCEFRDIDKVYIETQINVAKKIINRCQELRKSKSKEPNNYLFKKLLPFMQDICEMQEVKKSDLGEILFEYFKIVLSFVFDTFNVKNLKDTKKHVQAVDKIVLDEVEKIVSTYYDTMNGYLKRT